MKTQRKILMTLILIIAAALLLTASAFAEPPPFNLSEIQHDITVTGNADGSHKVSYGGVDYDVSADVEVEFIGTGSNFIELQGEAKVTLNSVNIANSSPVYINNNANAVITIRGDNTLTNDEDGSGNGIITVNDGNLTIKGDGKLTLVGDTYGAKIGSEAVEAMSGTIHITDHVEIITNVDDYSDGACIGSGVDGAFTGEVKIDGNSKVTAVSNNFGAGIGTSYMGKFTGRVIIGENAIVHAQSGANGAGIGTGHGNKSDFAGEIRIEGNADVTAVSRNSGAGIGVGYGGDFKSQGNVIIEGSARVFAITKYGNGAGIGSCENGNFEGSVIIRGNAIVHAKSGYMGAGIGSGARSRDKGHFLRDGKVIIEGNANVTAISDNCGAGIGTGSLSDFKGDIIIRGNSTVHAESVRGGAGIGTGGAGDFASGGRVIIEGSANVTAITNSNGVFRSNGAGIGTGYQADFEGEITIGGNSTVYAESAINGAGIGSGYNSDAFTGTITIKDRANVTAIGESKAPALGGADDVPMKGTITIKDFAIVTVCAGDECEGCIIGANGSDDVDSTGTIEILGNAQILRHEDHPEDFALIGAPIGSFTGEIKIGMSTIIFNKDGMYVNQNCYVKRNKGEIVIVEDPAPASEESAKRYEIKLDPNRGKTTVEKLITDENGKVANFPDAQRKGYVFMGWYDALTGGKKVDRNTVFTKNTTIYAMWKLDVRLYAMWILGIDGDTFAQKKAETTRYLISAINASSNMFTVSVKSSDGGWINPKETRIINYGGKLTVSAFPDGGKKVVSFIVDGEDKGSISTYTFKNIRENHTVEVVFG